MIRPVIFLAFANKESQPLLDLQAEDDAIYPLFLKDSKTQNFICHRDQFTTSEKLVSGLQEFPDQLSVFHFGGHAGDSKLQLADKEAMPEGLAVLLGKQAHLRCVFLNGCHTVELADELLAQGVPVVVATDRAIGDQDAIELAKKFYQALVNEGQTIKKAFELACDAVRLSGQVEIAFQKRGARRKTDSPVEESFSWGLYYQDEKALNWRLTSAFADVNLVSRRYGWRIASWMLAVFGLFSWSNIHVGIESTATFLALGPLAILGIARFFSSFFQSIAPKVSLFSKSFLFSLLKVPFLIGVGIFILFLFLFCTSVVVKHADNDIGEMTITNAAGESLPQLKLESQKRGKSRLLLMKSPFQPKLNLNIENYQQANIKIRPFMGKRIAISDLQAIPSLLIRLTPNDIRSSARISLQIERPNGDTFLTQPIGKPSIMIGPRQIVGELIQEMWKDKLLNSSRFYGISPEVKNRFADNCVKKWEDLNYAYSDVKYKPGDSLKISKVMNDSIYFTINHVIANQRINDVLLEKKE